IKKCRKLFSSLFFDYSGTVSPFDYENLPHPFHWTKRLKYKRLYVEIGTGHGEAIKHLSSADPEDLFVGFEITKKYSKKTANKIRKSKNAYVFKAEAYSAILNLFSNNSIDGIYILFPDPWHKKRHHKRRPITTKWLKKVSKKLKPGGFIIFATDWEEYFDYAIKQFQSVSKNFEIGAGKYTPSMFNLPKTHYYTKWLSEGRRFNYIKATRKA
ncbi:tRNA (guanosine(46)-N7)-methyltransferase TrmB, partial [Candidatus Dojkabacteria bacterium]|nr:tRNA (guanosine(46)-N7)-methyltransferase TrmB [Candidatus Dojkabacteria bacterium]